jgi:hypothetical protein
MQAAKDDIDPAKYAGESWYDTTEYARPDDIDHPWTRGEVGREGDYYPPAAPPRQQDLTEYEKAVLKTKSKKKQYEEKLKRNAKTLMQRYEDGEL